LAQRFLPQVFPIRNCSNDSIVSFIHTLVSAIVDFFRSITLADIIAGLKTIIRGIMELPKLLWRGLKALGRGIHATLVAFFGALYWCIYYIMWGLWWVCTFVPKRIGRIIMQIAGGIGKAFKELWVFISPKTMG